MKNEKTKFDKDLWLKDLIWDVFSNVYGEAATVTYFSYALIREESGEWWINNLVTGWEALVSGLPDVIQFADEEAAKLTYCREREFVESDLAERGVSDPALLAEAMERIHDYFNYISIGDAQNVWERRHLTPSELKEIPLTQWPQYALITKAIEIYFQKAEKPSIPSRLHSGLNEMGTVVLRDEGDWEDGLVLGQYLVAPQRLIEIHDM